MKKLLPVIALLLTVVAAQAQENHKYLTVDMAVIERLISDSSTATYYPKLLKRYYAFDTTLALADYRLIYYGFARQEIYTGYNSPSREPMDSLFKADRFEKLITYCDSVLLKVPVSFNANLYRAAAMRKAGIAGDEKYVKRVKWLLQAIYSSGNGTRAGAAFKIIYVSDEYSMMYDFLELKGVDEQELMDVKGEKIDKFTIRKTDDFPKGFIFFNTTETFYGMSKSFK